MTTPSTVCLDFDGVIHKYSKGWYDGTIYDPPTEGAEDFIKTLLRMYRVFVCSTRESEQIFKWWYITFSDIPARIVPEGDRFWNEELVVGITNRKLAAICYIDDRAIHFAPNEEVDRFRWHRLLTRITKFHPVPRVKRGDLNV